MNELDIGKVVFQNGQPPLGQVLRPVVSFTDAKGDQHFLTLDAAAGILKKLYDVWPERLEEIELSLRTEEKGDKNT